MYTNTNSMNSSGTSKSLGSGLTRQTSRTSTASAVRRYVPADFDFGFNLLPSSVDYGGVPLRMSLIRSSLANWTTSTVSVDHADITVNNGDMFFLLTDYFSLYFQDPAYGHPGVVAYDLLPADIKPFGGVDTRLFFSRPHFSIVEGENKLLLCD